jgi:GxxExxY protein
MKTNDITELIIGSAIEVHRTLGPGLFESAYEECLAYEFNNLGLRFLRQIAVPVKYKEIELDNAYRMDFLVEDQVIVELKSVDYILPIHEAQMLTYLRFAKKKVGLLINFKVILLKQGIHRYSL